MFCEATHERSVRVLRACLVDVEGLVVGHSFLDEGVEEVLFWVLV